MIVAEELDHERDTAVTFGTSQCIVEPACSFQVTGVPPTQIDFHGPSPRPARVPTMNRVPSLPVQPRKYTLITNAPTSSMIPANRPTAHQPSPSSPTTSSNRNNDHLLLTVGAEVQSGTIQLVSQSRLSGGNPQRHPTGLLPGTGQRDLSRPARRTPSRASASTCGRQSRERGRNGNVENETIVYRYPESARITDLSPTSTPRTTG